MVKCCASCGYFRLPETEIEKLHSAGVCESPQSKKEGGGISWTITKEYYKSNPSCNEFKSISEVLLDDFIEQRKNELKE